MPSHEPLSLPRAFLLGAGASRHAGYPLMTELYDAMSESLREAIEFAERPNTIADRTSLEAASRFMTYWKGMRAEQVRTFLLATLHRLEAGRTAADQEDEAGGLIADLEILLRVLETSRDAVRSLEFLWSFLDCVERAPEPAGSSNDFEARYVRYGARTLLQRVIGPGPNESETMNTFCQALVSGDIVLTTNYDLLVDCGLSRTGLWSPVNGYGLDEKARKYATDQPASQVGLLKLHGSINWTAETRYSRLGPESPRKYWIHFDWADRGCAVVDKDWHYLESEYHQPDWLEPNYEAVVVEPAFKSRHVQPPFGEIWKKAYEAVRNIRSLIIIGYSFSVVDDDVSSLIGEAWHRGRLSRLVVIDPNEDVGHRLRDKWGGDRVAIEQIPCRAEEWGRYRHRIAFSGR